MSAGAPLGLAVPLYDEAAGCVAVVRGLRRTFAEAGEPLRLALVNNGSRDGTAARVDALCAGTEDIPLHLATNAGYGGGILAGLAALHTPWLGWVWGDGQIGPDRVLEAWRLARANPGALVKVRRVGREDGLARAVNSRVYNAAMRGLFGVGTSDVNGCPKILPRALLVGMELRSTDWFLDPECVLKAQAMGVPIVELDAVMGPRRAGRSKVRWTTSLRFARQMLAWKLGWRP